MKGRTWRHRGWGERLWGERLRGERLRGPVGFFLLLAAGCGGSDRDLAVERSAQALQQVVDGISESDMRHRIGVLAHDSMRGRETPSPELEATAAWIAGEFRAFGLEPAFDTEYVRHYPIRTVLPDTAATWAVMAGLSDTLWIGRDLRLPFGAPATAQSLSGGVTAMRAGAGDVPDASEVQGRHLVLDFEGNPAQQRQALQWIQAVRRRGPLSVWVLSRTDDRSWAADARLQSTRTVVGERDLPPMITVRQSSLERAFGADASALLEAVQSDDPVALNLSLQASLGTQILEENRAPNVAALLPGSDPDLADEIVIFSAHMDHVGVGRPDASGDSIYNGADDDASGTSAVLEVAEAMAALDPAPRRSVMFLLVSGEEKGLWGSQTFVENAPVPIDRFVANLNADMVGRNWSDTIVVIGKEHSDLGDRLEEVNERHPELGMTAIDDLWPEENFYGRSDHYNFARAGVPVLFFFNGTHDDYHRPSDELELIDTEKAARIARLMFYLGLDVADRDEPPQWRASSRRRIVQD